MLRVLKIQKKNGHFLQNDDFDENTFPIYKRIEDYCFIKDVY